MLPVTAWPPGPPGSWASPFGAPREIDVGQHDCGFVLPKGTWIVSTGSNRVVMFTPSWEEELYNQPCRALGTGFLPGSWAFPAIPPAREPIRYYNVRAQVAAGAGPQAVAGAIFGALPAEARGTAATQIVPKNFSGNPAVSRETWGGWPPQFRPPVPQRFMTHDAFLEAWRAWQRRIRRTDPPIPPGPPGRRPPNWAGWRFVNAPSRMLVGPASSGTVLADGQNVVIQGTGFAKIVQAFGG
jgi:hypothetical protein